VPPAWELTFSSLHDILPFQVAQQPIARQGGEQHGGELHQAVGVQIPRSSASVAAQ